MMRKQSLVCVIALGIIGGMYPLGYAMDGILQAEQYETSKRTAREMESMERAPSVVLQAKENPSVIPYSVSAHQNIKFKIDHILIHSVAPQFMAYQEKLSMYEGKRLGAEEINNLTKILTDALMADGYITTQVSVPHQDLSTGTLVLEIHPGRIESIRFEKPVAWGTWRNAFPVSDGDILNIRALEQGLEQMKRVPNQDISMKLLPGDEPYTSSIVLSRTESSPIKAVLSIDNGGYEETGKWESSISTSWYNPLGLNDVFTYTYGKDIEKEDAKLGSNQYYLSYSIPYGWYTFTVSTYRNHFRQTVATLQPYLSTGTTEGDSISVERVLRRDQTSKTSLSLQMQRKERHNYIDDEEIEVQKERTTAYEIGIKHRQYAGHTQADIYGYFRKGVGGWGAEKQPWEDGIHNGTPRYRLLGLQLSIQAPVQIAHRTGAYSFRLVGQYTPDRLSSSSQISIGGRYTVRGFDGKQSLSGEYGAYMQQEISIPIDGGRWHPYIGIDAGFVGGPSTVYEVGKALVGAAIGIRGNLSSRVYLDAHVGTPIYKPEGFRTSHATFGCSMYIEL